MHLQASDNVVWSIIRRSNCKARPHASFNARPFFTHERNNLIQRQVFKYSGFRDKVVGVKKIRTKHKSDSQFGLVLSRGNARKRPSRSKKVVQIALSSYKGKKVNKLVRRLTNFKLYRPELSKAAINRIMKIRTSGIKAKKEAVKYQKRRIRINKKRGRYARRRYTKSQEKKDAPPEEKKPTGDQKMELVD